MMVEVSINLVIFCPFMEDIIVNKFNSDMIITVNWSDRKNSDSHVLQKREQPDDFSSGASQSTIFRIRLDTTYFIENWKLKTKTL